MKIIRKLERIGDILIVELYDEENKFELGKELLSKYKVRTVVLRKRISGIYRRPIVEVIAGDKNTETIYKENGCLYKMDVSKVMFSLGNSFERMRMSRISNENEIVLDMFAGIGQFSIQIAKHSKPKKVIAIDINPDAYHYLKENIRLNKLDNVIAMNCDNRKIQIENFASRIIMGWIFDTYEFLPYAIKYLNDEGIIHFHILIKKGEEIYHKNKLEEILSKLCKDFEIIYKRIVKSYAPKVFHWVFDIYVKKI